MCRTPTRRYRPFVFHPSFNTVVKNAFLVWNQQLADYLAQYRFIKTNDPYNTRVFNDSVDNRQGHGYFFLLNVFVSIRDLASVVKIRWNNGSQPVVRHGNVGGTRPYLKKNIFFYYLNILGKYEKLRALPPLATIYAIYAIF